MERGLPRVLIGRRVRAGWVGGDKYGGLAGVSWPPVGPAPFAGGQDKYIPKAEYPVRLAGRFEFDFQLTLDNQDQVNLVGGEPVLVDRLGPLAHPDHFNALPGEDSPDVPEWCGADLASLSAQDVEDMRARASKVTAGHGTRSIGDDTIRHTGVTASPELACRAGVSEDLGMARCGGGYRPGVPAGGALPRPRAPIPGARRARREGLTCTTPVALMAALAPAG